MERKEASIMRKYHVIPIAGPNVPSCMKSSLALAMCRC